MTDHTNSTNERPNQVEPGPDATREPVTSTANRHNTRSDTAVAGARPVMLLRYRSGVTGEAIRTVHFVPLPSEGQARDAGVALCGVVPRADLVEMVSPGQGMPCTPCMINYLGARIPLPPAMAPLSEEISGETDPLVAAVCYQAWGWPVTLRGRQVWLTVRPDTIALMIPVLLAARVTGILTQRHCPPLALIHPETPEHWMFLATRCPDLALSWPRYVHQSTDTLPLPPTTTPQGPVTWAHPPHADALRFCREFEVFAALRTALRDPLT
ncbi:MAG: hypothetical protein ACRDRU_14535 [Pseudonocardiaceae bacterium]